MHDKISIHFATVLLTLPVSSSGEREGGGGGEERQRILQNLTKKTGRWIQEQLVVEYIRTSSLTSLEGVRLPSGRGLGERERMEGAEDSLIIG